MFINVLRHVTGFHGKALMGTTMLHPYSLAAEWTMQETLLFGDQIFDDNGIMFFSLHQLYLHKYSLKLLCHVM
jgi:hypothetical protein